MQIRFRWALGALVASVLAFGCSSSDDGDNVQKKEIERETVTNSDFKPLELEATIDDLVDALSGAEAEDFEMTVVTKPFGGYWEPVKVGANRAMAELELTGQVEAPTDDPDAEIVTDNQVELVQGRFDDGYGGLGIAPMEARLGDVIDDFVDAGAPVVTIDSDAPDSNRQLYIGTNNTEAGKSAGETLAGMISDDSGTVIIYGHDDPDWTDGYNRTMAAQEALEDAGYTVVIQRVHWDEQGILDDLAALDDLIANADPPLVGMMGMFSNAYRCAEAAEAAGYEPGDLSIVAFDFEPDTLSYMDDGYIQATHAQRQYYMGYLVPYAIYSIRVLGLDATLDILADQMIDSERLDTGIDVIEADQIDDYNDFLDSLGISG
jgi:ribose transport system substrate-binding protein